MAPPEAAEAATAAGRRLIMPILLSVVVEFEAELHSQTSCGVAAVIVKIARGASGYLVAVFSALATAKECVTEACSQQKANKRTQTIAIERYACRCVNRIVKSVSSSLT